MARTTTETIERQSLEQTFATPAGGALAPRTPDDVIVAEKTLFGEIVTAQKVQAPRDEAKILQRIKVMAGAAGEAWYYRFPVWNAKKRRQDFIEGPSIDCTDAVARYYGNCRVDSAVVDQGKTWMIYSRFIDLETGYTLIRPFQQDKAGAKLGGEDQERKLSIALAIGTSKSQRNVVVHALNDFCYFAFDEAQKNLVERIGKNLEAYRTRAVERLNALGPQYVARVELAYGRKTAEWLAPDLARIVAELKAVSDGMALADDTWPPPDAPEPKRSDVTDVQAEPTAAHANGPAAAAAAAPSQPVAEPAPTVSAGSAPPPKNWRVPDDIVGQENILKALDGLLDMTNSDAEVDDLLAQNADRLAKITGTKRQVWSLAVRDRRNELASRA
jgi:hypothetical protein